MTIMNDEFALSRFLHVLGVGIETSNSRGYHWWGFLFIVECGKDSGDPVNDIEGDRKYPREQYYKIGVHRSRTDADYCRRLGQAASLEECHSSENRRRTARDISELM